MNQCGIRKHHGHNIRSLTKAIFLLPFIGKNFFRGIVRNAELPFCKDAAYGLLKGARYNWRRLLLMLGRSVFDVIDPMTSENRESVLIIDDSMYDRSRSKNVELLAKVYDHVHQRLLKGFRLLTLCWSDGVTCLPLDFSLLSSADAKNRLCESQKHLDKRCCAWQRRKEATQKATSHLVPMIKRVLSMGITAKYLLMDSWFMMPANITAVANQIKVIGMIKKTSKIHYGYDGKFLDVEAIYKKLKKRPGKAQILASAQVTLKTVKDGAEKTVPAKIVFVRHRHKKDWLALLTTDTTLNDQDVVRIYGKRWDIEVFFKMAKQHLKLAKEIQCRDFDALIAHTTIVFMRYMFLAYQNRMETDFHSLGSLFYACSKEIEDISFMESLYRILTLAAEQLKEMDAFCKKTVDAFFDAIIEKACLIFRFTKNKLSECSISIPES